MRRKEFIDTILNGISDTFDIYHNNLSYMHIITRTGISSRQLILQNYGI